MEGVLVAEVETALGGGLVGGFAAQKPGAIALVEVAADALQLGREGPGAGFCCNTERTGPGIVLPAHRFLPNQEALLGPPGPTGVAAAGPDLQPIRGHVGMAGVFEAFASGGFDAPTQGQRGSGTQETSRHLPAVQDPELGGIATAGFLPTSVAQVPHHGVGGPPFVGAPMNFQGSLAGDQRHGQVEHGVDGVFAVRRNPAMPFLGQFPLPFSGQGNARMQTPHRFGEGQGVGTHVGRGSADVVLPGGVAVPIHVADPEGIGQLGLRWLYQKEQSPQHPDQEGPPKEGGPGRHPGPGSKFESSHRPRS